VNKTTFLYLPWIGAATVIIHMT